MTRRGNMKRVNDFLASYVHTSLSKFFLEKVLDTEWHLVVKQPSDLARQESGPLALVDASRYSKLTGRLPVITATDTRQKFASVVRKHRDKVRVPRARNDRAVLQRFNSRIFWMEPLLTRREASWTGLLTGISGPTTHRSGPCFYP